MSSTGILKDVKERYLSEQVLLVLCFLIVKIYGLAVNKTIEITTNYEKSKLTCGTNDL